MPLLTLLSDFGHTDTYVGIMKGVIAQICPQVHLIDLTHAIAPQDLYAARFHLMTAIPYFPKGTVHLAVVDPGVGSHRQGIAIACEFGYLVGPNNGIFSGLLERYAAQTIVTLTNSTLWRSEHPSKTFHGRDIFAPAAAYLAQGYALHSLGEPLPDADLVELDLPPYQTTNTGAIGCIQHCDHFGNLITNIPNAILPSSRTWHVVLGPHKIAGQFTYSDVAVNTLVALPGSHGWLEIAINQGSAGEQLKLQVGAHLELASGSVSNHSGC